MAKGSTWGERYIPRKRVGGPYPMREAEATHRESTKYEREKVALVLVCLI